MQAYAGLRTRIDSSYYNSAGLTIPKTIGHQVLTGFQCFSFYAITFHPLVLNVGLPSRYTAVRTACGMQVNTLSHFCLQPHAAASK